MVNSGRARPIINTGSKQGITTPPGDTAYNVSKAAIKMLTEGLQHTLRNIAGCQVSAYLLVPGSTFTGMTRRAPDRKAGGRVDARAGDRFHAGAAWPRAISTSSAPTTRSPAQVDNARMTWAMAGPDPEPPAAVALAPRLRTRVRRIPGQGEPAVGDAHSLLPCAAGDRDGEAGENQLGARDPGSALQAVRDDDANGVRIVTFGCRLNAYESEQVRAQAAADGSPTPWCSTPVR